MEWTTSFDKLIVAVKMRSLCPDHCRRFGISPLVTLSDVVMEMFEGESSDLTRASHGRSGSDVDHCRGLHLPNMAVPLGATTKEWRPSAIGD